MVRAISCLTEGITLTAGSFTAIVAPPLAAAISKREVQVEGVKWLYGAFHGDHQPGCHGAIIGDGMGVGKTLQTIVLVHILARANQVQSVLILTPRNVLARMGTRV